MARTFSYSWMATAMVLAVSLLALLTIQKPAEAAFPGKNGKIAFVSRRDGNREIYTMNTDGSDQTRLTHNPWDDVTPAWSPDGTKIAFERFRYHDNILDDEIYTMNADGSGQTNITNSPTDESSPSWSPDGKKIAFYNGGGIYTANADGSNRTLLTTGGGLALEWQPNTSPTIASRRPAPGSTTTDRTPAIAAKISDTQTDLSETGITLRLDGKAVARNNFSYDRSTDRLRYVPVSNLSFGSHEVRVTARDDSGLGKAQTWSFKVVR